MRQRIAEAFEAVAGKGKELTLYDWERFMQELKQRGLILPEDIEKIYKHTPCFPLSVDTFIQTLCTLTALILFSPNIQKQHVRKARRNVERSNIKSKKLSRTHGHNKFVDTETGGGNKPVQHNQNSV